MPLNLGFGLGDIIDEFGRSLFEEIDYEQEAANAERFAAMFADNPAAYVLRVERMLSSRRVLTTACVDGAKMRDSQELLIYVRSNRPDPDRGDQRPAAASGVRLFPRRSPPRQSVCLSGPAVISATSVTWISG